MIKGTTSTGFKFELEEERIDDMEFVELLAKVDTDISALPEVLNFALGEEQKKSLYAHMKQKYGRASVTAMGEALEEIFNAAGESLKNSLNSPE